ncbi:MAG: hypothetical protein ACI841_004811 [Planctomycetota bacterium]|jgi:hypothetical protein
MWHVLDSDTLYGITHPAGEIDGDGTTDLMIRVPQSADSGYNSGELHVHDLAKCTKKQATSLVMHDRDELCVILAMDADGRVVTQASQVERLVAFATTAWLFLLAAFAWVVLPAASVWVFVIFVSPGGQAPTQLFGTGDSAQDSNGAAFEPERRAECRSDQLMGGL